MAGLPGPFIPIREPNGVLAMVMVVVGVITIHAALLHTRRRSFESPVELKLTKGGMSEVRQHGTETPNGAEMTHSRIC